MKRAFVIILDGLGIGELPDAHLYGDQGSNTLVNIARHSGGLNLPTLAKLGLGCILPVRGLNCPEEPAAHFGKMNELSPGKDSTTGHWELGGVILDKPFPTYPNGFPREVLDEFSLRTGLGYLGNKPASGTEIIQELGEDHVRTGNPIIYTSADSVFQIAAHQEIISLNRLYQICQVSRDFLKGEHQVARVIARPFTGNKAGEFIRTKYRKDFSLKPTGETTLKKLYKKGILTVGIGKINDLYAFDGIKISISTKTNSEGMQALDKAASEYKKGLIMANLVDFDMLWGHRNDVAGFKKGLEEFDVWLGTFIKELHHNDILIITADHGNDPTTPGTDHTREYVPIIFYGSLCNSGLNLGIRKTFADLDATICDFFKVKVKNHGESFYKNLSNIQL